MISVLLKHLILETACEVFFSTIQKNIITWKAHQISLSNIRKIKNDDGSIEYSTYYEGRLIKHTVTFELQQDLLAMHGVDIDKLMIEALAYEVTGKFY